MAELSSVMQRLDDQAKLLRSRIDAPQVVADADRALMIESIAALSEAILKVSRDVRALRIQIAERHS